MTWVDNRMVAKRLANAAAYVELRHALVALDGEPTRAPMTWTLVQ